MRQGLPRRCASSGDANRANREHLRKDWDFWQALPSTPPEFIRIENLEEKIGALETMLLDKKNFNSMSCGDGACLGCGEKTVVHLFTATVEALMQPRARKQVKKLDDLIEKLDQHVRLKLAGSVDLSDSAKVGHALDALKDSDVTLANFAEKLDERHTAKPLDPEWLQWVTQILAKLKHLKWQYTEGVSKRGRSSMGMINSTGCTSVWASTYPFNPYPFPWANHLFQDSTSMAMGVFEGHMSKMAEGFKAVRMAEIELNGGYKKDKYDDFFTYFNWQKFNDEEFALCPPVVAVGGDGSMYDIGFQNLSRMMMSGKPVKVLILDTQVYSNTGGQACTSGFTGQISDMAQYGKAIHGKTEIRKEIALIGMAHRTTYVLQSSVSNTTHLIEGFIDGLNAKRPALFNIYAACMPEHGIGDDMAEHQSKLAVESRAYPLIKYNPDKGTLPEECFDIEGNPAIELDWPTYTLEYTDERGAKSKMEVPLTFADFAVSEGRFRKQFRTAPRDTWNENMVLLTEFLDALGRRTRRQVPIHLGGGQEESPHPYYPGRANCPGMRRSAEFLACSQIAGGHSRDRGCRADRGTCESRIRADHRGTAHANGGRRQHLQWTGVYGGRRARADFERFSSRRGFQQWLHSPVDRFRAVHFLRRMHRNQRQDLRLRRSPPCIHQRRQGRTL